MYLEADWFKSWLGNHLFLVVFFVDFHSTSRGMLGLKYYEVQVLINLYDTYAPKKKNNKSQAAIKQFELR
jgi:hypothetical protein